MTDDLNSFAETSPAGSVAGPEGGGAKKRFGAAGPKQFKSVRAVAVTVSEAEVVTTSPLDGGHSLPLVVSPAVPDVDLVEWAGTNLGTVESHLLEHGALLFRGFGVGTATELERFARTMCAELLDDNGEHQRGSLSRSVYTPVFYPPEQRLLWHNENSFNHSWPSRIWFCCAEPAERGGETPIADSREVFRQLDPAIRARFIGRGVRYVRNYGTGPGLDWQTVFQTESRREVEDACRAARMEFEWWGDNQLRTSCVRPAAVRHPRTGEWSWFNQAQHWHVSCLDAATRASTEKLFREEEMPRNCYYGDGGRIADSDMEAILSVYGRLEVSFGWRRGDVMLLDNILAAHGRKPFAGRRTLLVTMGCMLSYDDCEAAAGSGTV